MSTEQQTTTPVANKNSRLYVGNLTANVKEEDLVKKFEAFGIVVNSKIVKNEGPARTSVFGFVEMETEDNALKAIAGLNKTDIDGQSVDVEVAKDSKRRRTHPRKRTTPTTNGNNTANSTTNTATTGDKTNSPSQSSGRRTGGRRIQRKQQGTDKPVTSTTTTTTTTSSTASTAATTGDVNGTTKPQIKRKGRLVRVKKDTQNTTEEKKDKEQSKTTLFVTNLPYSWNNDNLLEIFKDYSPKGAHIIVNKRTSRSKGFGFVDFNDEAEQQKALALNKKNVKNGDKDREIYVKVAFVADLVQADSPSTTTPPTTTA